MGTSLKPNKLLEFGFDIKNPDYNIPKFAMISLSSVTIILIFFTMVNLTINNNITLGLIELCLSFVSVGIILYYKKYKHIESFLLVTTIILFIVTIAFYFNSAKVLFSSVWLFFFPLVVFLLNGVKIGRVFSFIYILIITITSYFDIGIYTNFTGFLNITVGLILFTILAYYFESNRIEAFNKIKSINDKLQISLSENEKLLVENKRFIADTVHQIRTPLTNIMMNSEMIKMIQKDNSSIEYIDQINASINMLTNSYEDLSYITSNGEIQYNPILLSLSDMVKNRIIFFTTISNINEKEIISNIHDDIHFTINQIELERLIDNNISNAIKYAHINKPITINLTKQKDTVTLLFCSYGNPIKATTKLFEKNYRENEAQRGLGLGLNIVKNICTKYNITYSVTYENGQNIFTYSFMV